MLDKVGMGEIWYGGGDDEEEGDGREEECEFWGGHVVWFKTGCDYVWVDMVKRKRSKCLWEEGRVLKNCKVEYSRFIYSLTFLYFSIHNFLVA